MHYRLFAAIVTLLFVSGLLWAAAPYACRQCSAPKFIDGRFDDWSETAIALDGWSWRPADGQQPVYGGVYDLSSSVRLAWDKDNLYVAISVLDDVNCPAANGSPDTGDAVLLTLATAEKQTTPIDFLFTRRDITDAYQRNADNTFSKADNVKIGVGRITLPIPADMPHEAQKTVPTRAVKLYYELSIPWASLPKISPKVGASLGAGVQILDCDDMKTLRGSLKWRGGNDISVTPGGYAQMLLQSTGTRG